MADYYEVSSVRKDRNGTNRWTRLGVAFPHKQGDGFNISLSAVPAPEDGEFKLVMMRPKERDDRQEDYRGNRGAGKSQNESYGGSRSREPLDDDVPF